MDFKYDFKDKIKYKDKEIKMDLDFKNVIKYFNILKEDMPDITKFILATNTIIPNSKLNIQERVEIIPLISQYIYNLSKKIDNYNDSSGEDLISFNKDISAIYAAFMSNYNIDLFDTDLHFLKFLMLINNIGKDTRLYEIVSIRAREIPLMNENNKDYINSLHQLKSTYTIDTNTNLDDSLESIFNTLKR